MAARAMAARARWRLPVRYPSGGRGGSRGRAGSKAGGLLWTGLYSTALTAGSGRPTGPGRLHPSPPGVASAAPPSVGSHTVQPPTPASCHQQLALPGQCPMDSPSCQLHP